MTSTLLRAGRAPLRVALGALVLLALAIVVVPRLTGWVPLTIVSGSMEPAVPAGSQVVVEPVEGDEDAARLGVGDVVTFMPYPQDPTLVTHRIVGRTVGTDGSVSFTTRGDANGAADPWVVTATQLRGEVRYHVPYAGYVATVLDENQKSAGAAAVAVVLFGYAARQVATAARQIRRGRSAPVGPDRPENPVVEIAGQGARP